MFSILPLGLHNFSDLFQFEKTIKACFTSEPPHELVIDRNPFF